MEVGSTSCGIPAGSGMLAEAIVDLRIRTVLVSSSRFASRFDSDSRSRTTSDSSVLI